VLEERDYDERVEKKKLRYHNRSVTTTLLREFRETEHPGHELMKPEGLL